MLPDLDLLPSYRSGRQNLLRDFYLPCFEQSIEYRRAVGFFTSSSLSAAAKGLSKFISKRGAVRLVASPLLNKEDIEAILGGYSNRERVISSALVRELQKPVPDPEFKRLEFLAWLIAEGLLDIKIAIVSTHRSVGIYHEKFGIFTDEADNHVVFSGSANESYGGLVSNFESIDVFRSWIDADTSRVKPKLDDLKISGTTQLRSWRSSSFQTQPDKHFLSIAPTKFPHRNATTTCLT